MPDRYTLQLGTSVASNTGGPYTATWDRAIVTTAGTIRTVWASASSISSNAITNKVEIYKQSDAPSHGSNTATTVLVSPITLDNDLDAVPGTISQAGATVAAGDVLELRTNMQTAGAKAGFSGLTATVEIERT